MITAQEIREKTFEKAVFGGYDMAAVDSLLETVATDLELLQKENSVLKSKMKVLVGKVEEYRGNEDALRMAVVSAQRLGNMIEAEAKAKADALVSEAKARADAITRDAHLEVEMENARLEEAKKASVRFVENMQLLCSRQASFLETVGEMDFMKAARTVPVAEPAPAADPAEIHETVKSIEETVAGVTETPELSSEEEEDALATRAFRIVTDPADDLEQTNQFSFDDFGK